MIPSSGITFETKSIKKMYRNEKITIHYAETKIQK